MGNNHKSIIAGAILQSICLIIVGGAVLVLLVSNM
jgi:hypothetical protein